MTELENYPGQWAGNLPQGFDQVLTGQASIHVPVTSNIEYLGHLGFPVWKPLSEWRVFHLGCGTGESALQIALRYLQAQITITDPFEESLKIAQYYAQKMGLENVRFLHWHEFLEEPFEEGGYDLAQMTRPFQHFSDLDAVLTRVIQALRPGGLFQIYAYTGSDPSVHLLFPEEVQSLKEGNLDASSAQALIQRLIDAETEEGVDTLRGVDRMMRDYGFGFVQGLHPVNYDPKSYLPEIPYGDALFTGFDGAQKAYLSEQICQKMLRHGLLYRKGQDPLKMPSLEDAQARLYIPFRSPFAAAAQKEGRILLGLVHRYLMLEQGLELEDLSLPQKYYAIFSEMDTKKNFEQVHRRFLPMSWEVFWSYVRTLEESHLIHLHLPAREEGSGGDD